MTLQEKSLYHQIHPLKLGTDITAQVVATYFFWMHQLVIGLMVMLIPPIVVSALLVNVLDFTKIKQSAVGRYLKRSMPHGMEALRLLGTVPMVLGAWYHMPWLIGLGLVMTLFGWLRGLIFPQNRKPNAPSTVL